MISNPNYAYESDDLCKVYTEVINEIQKIKKRKIIDEDYISSLDRGIEELKKQNAILYDKSNLEKLELIKYKKSNSWVISRPIRKALSLLNRTKRHVSNKNKLLNKKIKIDIKRNYKLKLPLSEEKKAENIIKQYRKRLFNYGFIEQGHNDLVKLYHESENNLLKKLAARELSLYYTNKRTELGAKESLKYLNFMLSVEKNPVTLRQISIMLSENLEVLGFKNKAKLILNHALKFDKHIDLYFAYSNLLEDDNLSYLNNGLSKINIPPLNLINDSSLLNYDRLTVQEENFSSKRNDLIDSVKISIIMPAYNAADVISTSIKSIQKQTWSNFELIIVDDFSQDSTEAVVKDFVAKDKRIKYIKNEVNSGAYVSRNIALKYITGDLLTVNDADDWSHPKKLEVQALHILENNEVMGNTTELVRANNELRFNRRGKFGSYVFSNISSFMFKVNPVLSKIGSWDSVRFGADSELIRRVRKVFGNKAVVNLQSGPLSFQRQSDTSLTANSAFGYHGFFMGVRQEYVESLSKYHNENPEKLYYAFPQKTRPFPVPKPMLPSFQGESKVQEHYDVIMVSDFRLNGGSNMSNVEEIKAQKRVGIKTGLIQLNRYDINPNRPINNKIRELIDGEYVNMIVYGESVTCDLLILRYPPILQYRQEYVPNVNAKKIIVVVNQTPMSDYSKKGVLRYTLKQANANLNYYFGKDATWYPIGPLVREALYQYHKDELKYINLSEKDWSNIIDKDEWKRNYTFKKDKEKIVIGRHSRDDVLKWPATKDEILEIYPDSENYQVKVLGGDSALKKVLGKIPSNWMIYYSWEKSPIDFLKEIDVFVYYTHHELVESFGRVIIEAMASGVPVIVPPVYKKLFKEAAIYAYPHEVKDKIDYLLSNEENYYKQVEIATQYLDNNFGYKMHIKRILNNIVSEITPEHSSSLKVFKREIKTNDYLQFISGEGLNYHFGQSAEDAVLLRIFNKKRAGIYVDVGAFHPKKYSNTYVLYKFYGWSGINIDPSANTIELFKKERPSDININCAVGKEKTVRTYYKFNFPARNTLSDKNLERQQSKKDSQIIGEEQVRVQPLSSLLDEYLEEKTIDFLNIDAEGMDLEVAQTLDWEKYRPRVIAIEDYKVNTEGFENSEIFNYMKKNGYKFHSHLFDTSIYVDKSFFLNKNMYDKEELNKNRRLPKLSFHNFDEQIYNEIHNGHMHANESLNLLVDLNNRLFDHFFYLGSMHKDIKELIEKTRINNINNEQKIERIVCEFEEKEKEIVQLEKSKVHLSKKLEGIRTSNSWKIGVIYRKLLRGKKG